MIMNTKLFYTFFLVFLISSLGFGQTTRTWTGNALDQNWQSQANWSPNTSAPQATDNVVISTPANNVLTNYPIIQSTTNTTCNSISFEGSTLSLTVDGVLTTGLIILKSSISSPRTTTISGVGTINCTSLTVGTASNPDNAPPITKIISTLSNFKISGDLTIYSSVNGSNTNNGTFSLQGGSTTLGGKIVTTTNGSGSGTKSVSRFEMNATGNAKTLNLNYGPDIPLTLSANVTSEIVLNGLQSVVNYAKNGDQTIIKPIPQANISTENTYTNLYLVGSGTKFFPNAQIYINNRMGIGPGVKADLNLFNSHSTNLLTLGGITTTQSGLWGSTNSTQAVNKNDTYFTNTGSLNVRTGSCDVPTLQTVTGNSGNYCGAILTTAIGLASSQSGVNYRLYNGTTAVGNVVLGTGSAITFGNFDTAGIYTILARRSEFCSEAVAMSGSVVLNQYDTPTVPTATKVDSKCATPTGSITVTPTTISPSSLAFAGGNYVNTSATFMNNLTAFTVEGWIKFDATTVGATDRISWFGQDNVVTFGVFNNKIQIWANKNGGGAFDSTYSVANVGDNNWHHVAAVGNGTNLILYIDGNQIQVAGSSTTNYGTAASGKLPVAIGGNVYGALTGNNKGFTGQMLKVGFWNRALTPAELSSLAGGFIKYNANQTGLLAGYNFTENSGTTLAAVGSSPSNGTLTNGTATTAPVWTDPKTYAWTGPNGFASSSKDLTNIGPGSYSLTTSLKNCSSTIAAPVVVGYTTTTKTWNGTDWSPAGEPTIEDDLVFNDNYNKDVNLSGCSCVVNNGEVVIKSRKTMTIVDEVLVNDAFGFDGTLTFEDKASLVQINDTPHQPNFGDITYIRNSAQMKYLDYTYWSSPVTGQNARALSPDTFKGDSQGYRGYKVVNGVWETITETENMEPGVGYIIQAPRNVTFPYTENAGFKGVPNNGSISVPLSVWNWNLIGNPYPSAISADQFLIANQNDIAGSLYFWTHNTPPTHIEDPDDPDYDSNYYYNYTADDYAMYNLVGGTSTNPLPPGEGTPAEGDNKVPSGFIAAGQSFIVSSVEDFTQGGDGFVNFNNAMRVGGENDNNSQFFKFAKSTVSEKHRVWLNLTNDQGLFKQILIGYVEGATNSYDNLFDGYVYNGNVYANFYSINEETDYTIQGRKIPFSEEDLVPLGFSLNLGKKANVASTFKIGIDHIDGDLTNQPIYLEDKIENKVWDLRKGDYVFTSLDGVYNDRFVLKYTNTLLDVDKIESNVNEPTVVVKNKIITIDAKAENIKKVVIFDISGKLIFNKDKVNNPVLEISNLKSANQVLLVKVVLENGQTKTSKVLFN